MKSILYYSFCLFLVTGLFPKTISATAGYRIYTSGNIEVRFNPVEPDKISSQSRKRIIKNMEKVMGKLPDRKNLPGLDIRITDSLTNNGFTRYSLNFATALNERYS